MINDACASVSPEFCAQLHAMVASNNESKFGMVSSVGQHVIIWTIVKQ